MILKFEFHIVIAEYGCLIKLYTIAILALLNLLSKLLNINQNFH